MRRPKYKNRKVEVDGITFDSVKEAKRYKYLKELEAEGKIKDLQMQVKYVLIPAQKEPDVIGPRGGIKKGKTLEKECTYLADFVYLQDDQTIVEDTKGFRTKDYIIKRKLMLHVHGIRIMEV